MKKVVNKWRHRFAPFVALDRKYVIKTQCEYKISFYYISPICAFLNGRFIRLFIV